MLLSLGGSRYALYGFFDYSGINIKRILSRGGNRIDHILDERNCLTLCIIHRSLHQGSAVSTLNLSGLHSHDSSVLDGVEVEGISISGLLTTLNRRIEVLFDCEHTLGHAFFTPLRHSPSIQTLAYGKTQAVR